MIGWSFFTGKWLKFMFRTHSARINVNKQPIVASVMFLLILLLMLLLCFHTYTDTFYLCRTIEIFLLSSGNVLCSIEMTHHTEWNRMCVCVYGLNVCEHLLCAPAIIIVNCHIAVYSQFVCIYLRS